MSMEDAIDGVKSYLTSNLESAIAAIETARSVTIPRWKELDTGFVLSKQYPNISIVPSETSYEYGEQDEFLNPWKDHTVSIQIAHAGTVLKTVQYVLIRYVEAIVTLSTGTKSKYQYGGLFEVVQLSDVEYSIISAVEDKSFVQITDLTLLVRELET